MVAAQQAKQLACTTCAKAKSRCIPGPPESGKCERCNRLGKPCLARSPAPPRPKTQTRRSRVADLEKRLTELSSQFQTGSGPSLSESPVLEVGVEDEQRGRAHAQSQAQSQTQEKEPGEATARKGRDMPWPPRMQYGLFPAVFADDGDGDGDGAGEESAWPSTETVRARTQSTATATATATATVTATATDTATAMATPATSEPPWPTGAEADRMLDRFHRVLGALSPFVVVPPDLSSDELRAQRPFLWKGVMVGCTFIQGFRQRLVGEAFLEEVSRAAFVAGESTLDVLQGLLLFISWYHHSLRSTRMVNVLFLARSLCFNLELGLGGKEAWLDRLEERDLDHLRAYAGTYYLNTVAFTTNKRVDVLMHTSYLESCCTALETAGQQQRRQRPSDALLVQLVRVQQVAQAIAHTVATEPSRQVLQLPLMTVVQSFQSQLESLQQALPPELAGNVMLTTHISAAQVLLGEVGLSESHCQSNLTPSDRLGVLWYCLRSLRAYFDIRCQDYQEAEEPRFLCMRGLDVTYALLVAGRLVTLQAPGWDLERIEAELRFWDIMDWLTDFLTMMTRTRRENGAAWEAEVAADGGMPALPAHHASAAMTEDSLERLLRVATGLKMVLKQEISRIKQDNAVVAGGWYPSPEGSGAATGAEKQAQAHQYGGEYDGGDLWKDMIDDYQWDMGEYQWL